MVTALAIAVLFVAAAHLVYVYGGYAFVLKALARLRGVGDRAERSWTPQDPPPTVTIYIGAKDEEDIILARLENAIDTTYPTDMIEIIVIADGCSDRTAEIAKQFSADHLHIRFRFCLLYTSDAADE